MARFGIDTKNVYGVPIPNLRKLAKKIEMNHQLALKLWDSGIHEAMLLACLIDDPEKVTQLQMEQWAKDFNSWDICDQCCGNLFDKTKYARKKALQWSRRNERSTLNVPDLFSWLRYRFTISMLAILSS